MVVVVSYMSYNRYHQLDPSRGLLATLGQHLPIRLVSLIQVCFSQTNKLI